MSIAAAILVLAQSVSPVVAEPSASRSRPVVATAQASARILRPARISFDEDRGGTADKQAGSQEVQRGRDENGTVWIEFS